MKDKTMGKDLIATQAEMPFSEEVNPAKIKEATAPKYHYRLSYARCGALTWIAHLDLMRTFERALLRATLPVVWSKGYNPRPAIEFALPVGVGIETRDDPWALTLSVSLSASEIMERLNRVLPEGLTMVSALAYEPGNKSLMARVEAAVYEFSGKGAALLHSVLERGDPLIVEKHSKRGRRTLDLRPSIRAFRCLEEERVEVTVNAGSQDNVRPDLLLQALSASIDTPFDWTALCIIRRAVVLN